MSPKHRKQKSSEDVLELRDLDSLRIRALMLAGLALMVLVYAMVILAETANMSLDQQEDLSDRLDKAKRQLRDATASGLERPRT